MHCIVECVCGVWICIPHSLYGRSVELGGGRTYYRWCLFCDVAWLLRCNIKLMMSGLICWWKSCGMGFDSDVVVCWGCIVFVW